MKKTNKLFSTYFNKFLAIIYKNNLRQKIVEPHFLFDNRNNIVIV